MVQVTLEKYNGLGSLFANSGDWVEYEMHFFTKFQLNEFAFANTGVGESCTYYSTSTAAWIEWQTIQPGEHGFVLGDPIVLEFFDLNAGTAIQFTRTVSFIDGNKIYFNTGLGMLNGSVFPVDGVRSTLTIKSDKKPDSFEFQINLTENGSSNLFSVIDGSPNRYEVQDVNSMVVSDILPLVQLGNRSGGLIKDLKLKYVFDGADGVNDFKIKGKIWQWGVIKDGYNIPPYYNNQNCLAPITNIKAFAQYGNPNGVSQVSSSNNQANTGYFNENFNGGTNDYTLSGIDFTDFLGNQIDKPDYSNEFEFQAVIETPGDQDAINSIYNIGMAWLPTDGNVYQDNLFNVGQNLILNSPDINFNHSASPDPTVYSSYIHSSGAKWDFQNLRFLISGSNVIVTGKVIPNAEAFDLFEQYPDGERRTIMWVGIGDYTKTGSNSNRVNLLVYDDDNYDAPTIGVQIPDVLDEIILDHGGNDITAPFPQNTTTEDDVLYKSNFQLLKNSEYQGIRVNISAFNDVTEDEFTLEEYFIDFSNVVFNNGVFEVDTTFNRGFGLPPASDRNHIKVYRNDANDEPTKYGITLEYGFLNDWRYWMSQSNVDNAFFDPNEPLDGFNKNWERFDTGDWTLRIGYFTRLDDVDDFNYAKFKIRPYEDDPNMSTVVNYTVMSTGANPTSLIANELMKVEATLTYSGYAYSSTWFEATYEDFESGNRWVLSSIHPQGGISSNPLKPIVNGGGLDVQFTAFNVAVLTFYVDTNILSVNEGSLSFRAFSLDDAPLPIDGVQFGNGEFAHFGNGEITEFGS